MLKVVKGRLRKPLRVVLYGVEGIGKTTLASQFPKPIVLDTENGSTHLEVDRVQIGKWVDLEGAIHSLVRDPQGYETVVIDSADWAERLATTQLLEREKKPSIESFGFGKGYVQLAEIVGKALELCDQLVARGINVVWVAHSKVVRVSPPDQTDGYDRWELKLHKQVGPLFKEWADAVLFLTYRTLLVDGNDGRKKGKNGKERVMHAERCAAFDAKNRFGLGELPLPMTIDALAPMFAAAGPGTAAKPKGWREQVMEAATVEELGTLGDRIDAAESGGKLTADQAETLRGLIAERHESIDPQPQEAGA